MNILEAIKSGKRFRRKSWNIDDWVSQDREDFPLMRLTRSDIKADDWEVESQQVMITREQFNAAWEKIVYCHDHEREEMIEELGL